MYLFAYGSILDPASAARTLGRPVAAADLTDAIVLNVQRDWGVYIPVRDENDDELDAAFLDVQPAPGHYVNGALIALSEDEFAMMRRREAQYDAIDVTGDTVTAIDLDRPVVTFMARAEFRKPRPGVRAAVPDRYRGLVEAMLEARGPVFDRHFAASTQPPEVGAFTGAYTFADPDQAASV